MNGSKNGKVLIVNGPDAHTKAEELSGLLKEQGFEVVLVSDWQKDFLPAENNTGLLVAASQDFSAAVVIASPQFFEDCNLVRITLKAAVQKRFIPVLFGSSKMVTPCWFSAFSSINLNCKKNRERQTQSLVTSLMNHGL